MEIANHAARIAAAEEPSAPGMGRKIVGRSGADYVLLDTEEVLAIQAERELVWIIAAKQRLLATQSLCRVEERLPANQFQRVHRNALVNVNHIRKMSALSSQRWLITLSNSLQIVVSKRQAHNIRRILHWWVIGARSWVVAARSSGSGIRRSVLARELATCFRILRQ